MTQSEINTLERLIDKVGLADIVDGLALIAEEKADHIAESYGGNGTAEMWADAAEDLGDIDTSEFPS